MSDSYLNAFLKSSEIVVSDIADDRGIYERVIHQQHKIVQYKTKTLIYSLEKADIPEEIQNKTPYYIQKENALEEISKLKDLILESVHKIEDYTKEETITEKLDDFRLRNHYIEGIIQKAILVGQEGLGEVAKAISIATSQVWTASISREKFTTALREKIKSAVQHEYYEESEIQSTYEIMIQMDTEDKPVSYLLAKIFGGISPNDVWQAIEDGERGDFS
jgi:hypothetical protein